MSWLEVGTLESIPARGARRLVAGGIEIAVFRTGDDRVFALRDRCPHRGGPLSQGIVHGHCVTCPLHDWVIDLERGEAVGPDEGATETYAARVDDGVVFVDVPARGEVAENGVDAGADGTAAEFAAIDTNPAGAAAARSGHAAGGDERGVSTQALAR